MTAVVVMSPAVGWGLPPSSYPRRPAARAGKRSAMASIRPITVYGEPVLHRRAAEVEVIDDGQAVARETSSSGGFGLTGIRERAAMHGGESEIGSRPDGGFRVRVRIPVAT